MTESIYYNWFLYGWIALGIFTYPFLIFGLTAPFGRHTRDNFGPMINNSLAWILMESPTLWLLPLFFFIGANIKTLPLYIFLGLWLLHYVNRTLIYPFRIKNKKKKMPLLIAVSGLVFQFGNCYLLGWYFGDLAPNYTLAWIYDPRFIIGVLIFFAGMAINMKSDNILLALRKPGETGYKIPNGWFFKYVSCPNFLGELVEWTGFAILTWSLPGFAFALWTFANLVPRAIAHHKWYKEEFPLYPKERKAVIPFVL